MMTVFAVLPIMWSTITGADVMKRIAAPMVGIVTSFFLELPLYRAIYVLWKSWAYAIGAREGVKSRPPGG
jgi:copper/silver efflux system protein